MKGRAQTIGNVGRAVVLLLLFFSTAAALCAPLPRPVARRPVQRKPAVPQKPSVQQKPAPKKLVIRVKNYNNVPMLNMEDVATFYGMKYLASGKSVTFLSKYSTITFTVNSRLMTLNNVQVYLSRPVTVMGGINYMGKSDFQLVLEPILRPKAIIPKTGMMTIVVDPGHGGKDVGAINGTDYEKAINLQVATRLANKLRSKGFKVFMTRSSDKDVSLEQRTKFMASMKADLFVSIHCNSASAAVTGLETYIATPAGDPPVGDNVASKGACPANTYDLQNAYLAYYTQRAILQHTQCEDRGMRRKRFYVIRNTSCPAMLIEIGFISNDAELKALKTPVRQEKIAEAIAESVVKFRDLKKQ